MLEFDYTDLFSGIAGMALGLQMAGIEFKNHYHSEIDTYANKVYARHFPRAINLGDVTKINGKEIPQGGIITAGFPCQDISCAGKQVGLQGLRSGLFYQIIRIAADCRPRIILLENVSRLLTIGGGCDFGDILNALESIGYDAEWHCVPASHVGAPHPRDRAWIVAYPYNTRERTPGSETITHEPENSKNGQYARIEFSRQGKNVPDPISNTARGAHGKDKRLCGCEGQSERKRDTVGDDTTDEQPGKFDEACSKRRKYSTSQWCAEPNVGRVANGVPSRVDRLKCLGNAVVPQVVEFIARTIIIPILESNK